MSGNEAVIGNGALEAKKKRADEIKEIFFGFKIAVAMMAIAEAKESRLAGCRPFCFNSLHRTDDTV